MSDVIPLRETARQRRRRIAAEEEQWAEEAYAEWLTTDEGGQQCYVLSVLVDVSGFQGNETVASTVVDRGEE